jgi:2-iminobutanoate/2-iminopropanoate deaminase
MLPINAERLAVHAPLAPAALGPYSHAVMTNGLLFCSGQLPLEPSTGTLVGNGAAEQTAQCLRNLEAICAQAGTSLSRSVRLTLFLTDLADFEDVNKAYATFFEGSPPARVAVQVAALAGGALIEIDAIAAV